MEAFPGWPADSMASSGSSVTVHHSSSSAFAPFAAVVSLAAGVTLAMLLSGRALDVGCGAGAGLLLGLTGHLFALAATRRNRAGGAGPAEDLRVWGLWATGIVVRFVLIVVIAGVFWFVFPEGYAPAMLAMAAVWLAAHVCEIVWLWRQALRPLVLEEAAHG